MLAPILEGGCILESVADTLICNDLHINVLFGNNVTLSVELVDFSLSAVGNENGEISKVVEVVVDRLDSERAHTGNDH